MAGVIKEEWRIPKSDGKEQTLVTRQTTHVQSEQDAKRVIESMKQKIENRFLRDYGIPSTYLRNMVYYTYEPYKSHKVYALFDGVFAEVRWDKTVTDKGMLFGPLFQ